MSKSISALTVVGVTMGFVVNAGSVVTAQERSCAAKYKFNWGQQTQGLFSTRAEAPCRVGLLMSGNSTISSAQIVEGPRNGVAAAGSDGTIRFQPKSGFVGADSMTVRYKGTGAARVPREATVTFAITVY
jgi:hypothetical protein